MEEETATGYIVTLVVMVPVTLATSQADAEQHVEEAFDEGADVMWKWAIQEKDQEG